jgi:hypothetical protein
MAAIEASANGAGVVAAARCSPSVACNSTWALPAAAVVDIYAINSRAGVPVSMGLCTGGRAPLQGAPTGVSISSSAHSSLPLLRKDIRTCTFFLGSIYCQSSWSTERVCATLSAHCDTHAPRRMCRQLKYVHVSQARQRAEATLRAQAPLWRPRRAPHTC